MQRRGFERDDMRSRAQERRGWESGGDRFRPRYGDSPSGGSRGREEAYDEAGDFEHLGFEDSDERAYGERRGAETGRYTGYGRAGGEYGGGFELGHAGEYGRSGELGRAGLGRGADYGRSGGGQQYGRQGSWTQRGGEDFRGSEDYEGPQGYNEEEGWFRGQGMRDEQSGQGSYSGYGSSGRQARSGQSSGGFGGQRFGASQRFGGGERDYAHGGFRGQGQGQGQFQPRGEGFFRRANVGQWGDDLGGPHGGRGPEGYRRADDRIKEEICDQLTDHSYLDASAIRIEVKDGEVTLSGTVHSREEKRLAEDVAESARGVGEVRNDLRVQAQGRQNESHARQTIGSPHGATAHAGAEMQGGDADKQKQQTQRSK